jgi:hypothetical protein
MDGEEVRCEAKNEAAKEPTRRGIRVTMEKEEKVEKEMTSTTEKSNNIYSFIQGQESCC